MGFSHIIMLAIGFYGGSHMAKHYELKRMEHDLMKTDCGQRFKKFFDEYRRERPTLPEANKQCSCGSQPQ